jgi:anhydro-N-acetylmuramic acid kinase
MPEERSSPGERIVAGLMSGTSADGVDAALVRIEGEGLDASLTLLAHDTLKYSPSVRQRILSCMGPSSGNARELALLDAYVGELFAHALLHICKKAAVPPQGVSVAGSHGQTLYHHPVPVPYPGFAVTSSLQVGNPAIIAERAGITVVSDFRARDMAAGGQGAPLAPYLDYMLYHHRSRSRLILNIGGIANLTAIPAGSDIDGLMAFDTGPGNCLMDLAAWHFSGGKKTFDQDGAMARGGRESEPLLTALLEHPFLKKTPPKSVDREDFGAVFLDSVLARFPGLAPGDVLATLAAFTVRCIASAVLEFCLQKGRFEELVVSGGGVLNPVLMDGLQAAFPKLTLSTSDDYSIPSKAKEAVLMAVLADATLHGWPSNVPSATGARGPLVLGSITPGGSFFEGALGQNKGE